MAMKITSLWRSLKTRVTLLTLVIFLVGIWSLAYYVSMVLREDLHGLLGEQQFSAASIVAADLNHEIDFRLRALEKVAAEMTPVIFSDPVALQAYLEDRQLLPSLFNGGYFVTTIDGTATASIPPSVNRRGVNYIERDHIAAALREGKATVSKPVIGKMLHAPVVSMAVPIRSSAGNIIGALAGVIDLNKPNFLDEIAENRYGKTGGFLVVAKRYRLVVAASDKSRIMEELPPPGINPAIDRFIQGFEGFDIYTNPKRVEILASVKGVPAAGWYLAAMLPTEEAFAPIRHMQMRMVLATLILTILTGGLTWVMLRRQLSPMFAAVRTLSLLSDANLPVTALPITRQDEVGLLIGAFNRLLAVIACREAKLRESEEYHRSILKAAMDGILLVDSEGRLLEVNAAYCRMSGYSEEELSGMRIRDLEVAETADDTARHIRKIMEQGQDSFETRHRRKDGSFFDVEINIQHRPGNGDRMVAFLRDISERKLKEQARAQTVHMIQAASHPGDLHASLAALTASIRDWSRCEAVGIRLQDGSDYPYFESAGFQPGFIQLENNLCTADVDGNILRDSEGNPLLECMCGNILCGRFDSGKPFFTAHGSFWSNNTTALLANTTPADRLARTRNRCNGEGYQSVALFPLRAGDKVFGLLQINDHRADCFTPTLIELLEGMAESLALSLARRQAEEALRQQEQFARATIDGLSAKICVLDAQGKIVITNHAWDRFAAENNAVGGTYGEGVNYLDACRLTPDISAIDIEETVSGIKAVMDGNLPTFIKEYPCHSPEVERWFICKANPFIVAGAHFVVVSHENITDRKRSELALNDERQRLAGIIKGTNAGTWEWNVQTGETSFNERWAEIIGYTLQEISPVSIDTWIRFSDPEDLKASHELLEKHFRGELDYYECESRMKHKDGSWIWILDRGRVMTWSEAGKPLLMMGTHQDITQRKRAEAEKAKLEIQLQQAQKMESIGRLAGGVAHDFNNMLGVIIGHAELALMKMDHSSRFHADLIEIRNAAERSANLTQQLLAFARKQTIIPKAMNLNETITGMLKMLQRLIGENIALTWRPAPDLWKVKADPGQIDQILANLCVNSRDAIENTGRITIETQNCTIAADYGENHLDAVPGQYVRLSVSDDGSGMDKETLPNIFEPFYTTKELGKGTGLGLSTVFGIVKQNSGNINVSSEPGQGATFSIYLPRLAEETAQPLSQGAVIPLARGQETILLVEDEPAILDITALILEEQGYVVLKANTPRMARQLASNRADGIHLLLTDVIMPEMNGWDLAKNLRASYPDMKSLFMSGYTADVIADHGVLEADVHFIQKPFSLTDMVAKVREVLDKRDL